jgi:hypothetical protein
VWLGDQITKRLVEYYIWNIALFGAGTWTLRKVDQKYLESFEMFCWRRIEKIRWTDHVMNEKVLYRVKEKRNILHAMERRKTKWIGQSGFGFACQDT